MTGKTFEEALRRLEEVVRRLESGDISLEEALELFGEGVDLARHCHRILDQAEQRLEVLTGVEQPGAETLKGEDDF